jgi:hypothetical protein
MYDAPSVKRAMLDLDLFFDIAIELMVEYSEGAVDEDF